MRVAAFALAATLLASGVAGAQVSAASTAPVAPAAKSLSETLAGLRGLGQTTEALRASNLAETLQAGGPYTVFAPNNFGWDGLQPKPLQARLMRPEGKGQLAALLNYHVVRGALTTADLAAKLKAAGGVEAYLDTLNGAAITLRASGRGFVLSDVNGAKARIVVADVPTANGLVQVIDAVAAALSGARQALAPSISLANRSKR